MPREQAADAAPLLRLPGQAGDQVQQLARRTGTPGSLSTAARTQLAVTLGLLPMTLALIQAAKRQVKVSSVLGSQVAGAPMIASPDQVTKLEEDRICAYFASGHLYATPARQEPLL